MNIRIPALALCVATASLLAACGGGSDDTPTPSDSNSLITVSASPVAKENGIFGSTSVGLTDVEKAVDLGTTTCTFAFNNLTKIGDSTSTMSGKVGYREGAAILSSLEITVNGTVYAAGAVDGSTVDRANNFVRFGSVVLASTAADTNTITVAGGIPMRPNRASGC